MASKSATEYSIDHVYRTFNQVLDRSNRTAIGLPEFVDAFRELTKFFNHLNVVFSFIVDDLMDKFTTLENMHHNDPIHYRTVQSMIEYEKPRDDKTGLVALLRLLRALEFTYLFLQRALISPVDSSSPEQVAWEVYKETLHKRHGKAVRLSIRVATATIPKREKLKRNFLRGEIEPETSEKCFPIIGKVFRDIYELYEENDFLELVPL